jgi:hypothetical protein
MNAARLSNSTSIFSFTLEKKNLATGEIESLSGRSSRDWRSRRNAIMESLRDFT